MMTYRECLVTKSVCRKKNLGYSHRKRWQLDGSCYGNLTQKSNFLQVTRDPNFLVTKEFTEMKKMVLEAIGA